MLEYEKQMFLDIFHDDGLVIAAKGLGIDSVIVNLLKVYCDPGNLVFVLGAEGKQQEWLLKQLEKSKVNPQPTVVSSEIGVSEREQAYLKGGLWFVPSRILIVDIIKKRIPVDLITGFIVCKAHNILKNHQEAFVMKLYREGNKTGFIKAFSDQAPAFKGGFNKVEQILKALFIRNLHLWPRYHSIVKSSLNVCKPTVIELHLEMTSKMVQIQNSLLELIKQTVQELKRLNPSIDAEEVTVENAISESFHKVLHSQLDPVWHELSERTKSLLGDLKLFHYMILSLITLDSVSFYSLVKSERKLEYAIKGSGWHLLPSAEILFTSARQRVFPSAKSDNFDVSDFNLEPHPKWLVLSEVLVEIHREFNKEDAPERGGGEDGGDDVEKKMEEMFGGDSSKAEEEKEKESPADILILTRDERICSQLQSYLTQGSKEFLASQYRKFLFKRASLKKGGEKRMEEKEAATPEESKGKEEDEDEEKEEEAEAEEEENDERDADTYTLSLSTVGLSQLEGDKRVNLAGYFEDTFTLSQKNSFMGEGFTQTQATSSLDGKPPPVIVIKTYRKNLLGMPQVFEVQKPRWVIIYDAEITLVRQLEVYQRNNPNIPLRVYFLVFGGTIEEQAYLTSLRKEKEAFDYLIAEKSRIVIPADMNDFPELGREDPTEKDSTSGTRRGGFESPKKKASKVIVDMREFRSELPALLHAKGLDIEPLTITVGDYILTPEICIERKSVSDLIQSLNSGRMYTQAVSLTRHYARPMLLIEFDKDKPFILETKNSGSADTSKGLISKLQLLTLHFPQLRLLWSPSPQATAELFDELKVGHDEPDSAVALRIGAEEGHIDEDKFNPEIQEVLSNIPGVTNKNIYSLLLKGESLDNLSTLTKEELSKMVENSEEGEAIYNAFHKVYKLDESSASTATDEGGFKSGRGRGKRRRFH